MSLIAGESARNNLKYVKYGNQLMERRLAAGKNADSSSKRESRKDFCHYLINAKDPETGKGFTMTELYADSSLLISAGSDTTAITLSATLFYLLHYPSTLKRLNTEIRSTFASPDQISGKSITQVPYLRACLDEALRLSPPVPSHLPREVLPGGLTIDGEDIPAGTIVGTSTYAIHRNPEYYPDPCKYRPERWIVDEHAPSGGISSSEAVATARAAFCPFSLGRRGCIGKNVAYLELGIALAKLIYMYDMRLPEDPSQREPSGEGVPDAKDPERRSREEYQLEDHFLVVRDGPMVEFRAQEHAQ
jgi:cytochrome P450